MILSRVNGELVIAGRKYPGKKLLDIAKSDPSYVGWMYEKAALYLPSDIFYELEDVLKANSIKPFDVPSP